MDERAELVSAFVEGRLGENEGRRLLEVAGSDPALIDLLADSLEMHRALELIHAPARDEERDVGRILYYVRASGESSGFFARVRERAWRRGPRRAFAPPRKSSPARRLAAAAAAAAAVGVFLLLVLRGGSDVGTVLAAGKGVILVRAGEAPMPLRPGLRLAPGDRIDSGRAARTPPVAVASLRLRGGAEIDLAGGGALVVASDRSASLETGRIYARVAAPGFTMATPAADVRVNGTSFDLMVEARRSELRMESGRAEFANAAGWVTVEALQSSVAHVGSPPAASVPIRREGIWMGAKGGGDARALLGAGPAPADVSFPPDSGVVDVRKSYGARGDGVCDDTDAVQRAIDESLRRFRIVYFPNGVYRVRRTLTFGSDPERAKQIVLQGQSRDGTVIRLDDRAPGFGDAARRRPLLAMFEGGSTSMAFNNSIRDMTIDAGRGNAGAVGVLWMANNVGVMENVNIRSSDPEGLGAVGIDLSGAEPGPCHFKNVAVEGFDIGIQAFHGRFGATFEHLTLRGQRRAGIHNARHTLAMRGLDFMGRCPAIVQVDRGGMLFLADACLRGGGPAAIENAGMVHLRNVRQSGYDRLVSDSSGGGVTAASVEEYVSHRVPAAGPIGSLGLPVLETPEVPLDPPERWVCVDPVMLMELEDDTEVIRSTFDRAEREGKGTICIPGGLPEGAIRIGGTVRVPPCVCRIMGMDAAVGVTDGMRRSGRPLFSVRGGGRDPIVIERFTVVEWAGGDFVWVEHDSPRPVVMRHLNSYGRMSPYRGGPGCVLFVEDVCAGPWIFTGQKVWMRQIDVEVDGVAIENGAGDLWILGLHSERTAATLVRTTGGGRTEIFGGLASPSARPTGLKMPMFVVEDGAASFSVGGFAPPGGEGYDVFLRIGAGRSSKEVSVRDVDAGGRGGGGAFLGILAGVRR